MLKLINIALRTEHSFKTCYGHIDQITANQEVAVGIADNANTFGHVKLTQACDKAGIAPIYGVRLMVVVNPDARPDGQQGNFGPEYIFIAKNGEGLQEIYKLTKTAWGNFYFRPCISLIDVWSLSENVIVIAEHFNIAERIDFIGVSFSTSFSCLKNKDLPRVALQNNRYPTPQDKSIYECLSSPRNTEIQTYPQHILSTAEWMHYHNDIEAIKNTHLIAEMCGGVQLKKAEPVKYKGLGTLRQSCMKGAKKFNINILNGEYADRYNREIKLIEEKQFDDYFMIVADMVRNAKKRMLVGPARGSSAGSLVCYLTGITEVDPIKHGLLFERFIDINRFDVPDIDIDFPDTKRQSVIKDLIKKNGRQFVRQLATISQLRSKSALGEFAKALEIPPYETDLIKENIIERLPNEQRGNKCIKDTFNTTEIGKEFLEKYPSMEIAAKIEGHARHHGTHAAGVLVSNDPLNSFAGINTRDDVIMLDGHEAEYLNLLKIDVLGLRTLSILQDAAKMIDMDFHKFYEIDLEDKNIFSILNDMRHIGIFQFEGYALSALCRQIEVKSFDDVVALTAIARPGPLSSGAATSFVSRQTGNTKTKYIINHPDFIKHVEETYGVIIYQEQLMFICRDFAGMDWKDITAIRKGTAKSLGKDYLEEYKIKFINSAVKKSNVTTEQALDVWDGLLTSGGYSMNKSHVVSYSIISMWCLWMKYYHPLEFAVANLNNSKDDDSAINLLRDLVKNEGFEYVPVDSRLSDAKWSVINNKLYGGLINIKGIGEQKARKIIKNRENKINNTPAITESLFNPVTPFDILFPCEYYFNELFINSRKFGLNNKPHLIENISDDGDYVFIGCLVEKNLKDANDYKNVQRRNGQKIDGQSLYLNIKVKDDTDIIMCIVNRDLYLELGLEIALSGKEDEDWYLIRGKKSGNWRIIKISYIMKLDKDQFRD